MDSDYCQERAETCLEIAFSVDDGDQSAGWLYLADLWAELALTKGFGKKLTTIH